METLASCKAIFINSQQLFERDDGKLYITHFGELNSEKISSITIKTEEFLINKGEIKKVVKNLFNSLIEGLQNIINHGESSSSGGQLSYSIIGEQKNQYVITLSNLINNDKIKKISSSIDRLNKVDYAGLKAIYIETLTNGEISEKGGAGLGLITMAMKSKNKIHYESHPINNKLSLFEIIVKINKN